MTLNTGLSEYFSLSFGTPSPFFRAFPEWLYCWECSFAIASHVEMAEDQTGGDKSLPLFWKRIHFTSGSFNTHRDAERFFSFLNNVSFLNGDILLPFKEERDIYLWKTNQSCCQKLPSLMPSYQAHSALRCMTWHEPLMCIELCWSGRPHAGKAIWGCASCVLCCPYLWEMMARKHIFLYL